MFRLYLWILLIVLSVNGSLSAAVKSTTGNINFDVNNDGTIEMKMTADGVGIGVDPSANLHVAGVTSVSDNIYIGTTSGNSSIHVQGRRGFNIETVTSSTTLSGNTVVFADTSSRDIILTLPSNTAALGRVYIIKKISSLNTLIITTDGDLIDGNSEVMLTTGDTSGTLPSVTLISGGGNWQTTSFQGTSGLLDLIGWWRFDDSSGNTVSDSSHNNYTGNMQNNLTIDGNTITGISGNALVFDGTDDFISYSDLNGELDGISSFTISAWFTKTEFATNHTGILSKEVDVNNRLILTSGGAAGGTDDIFVGIADGSNAYGHTSEDYISNGTWYHVAIVYDGSGAANADRLKIYIDSFNRTLTFSNTIPAATDSNDAGLKVGEYPGSSAYWSGYIDDVKIYSNALTATEVKALFNSYFTSDNLIGHWKFEDDSGTTATDSSATGNPAGIGNDGTLSGTFDFSTNVLSGISGNALSFDGSDDKIDINDAQSDFDGIDEFSISAWFLLNDLGTAYRVIFEKGTSITDRVLLIYDTASSNDMFLAVGNGANSYGVTSGDFISADTWYHIVMVYNGNGAANADRLKCYIDGIERTLSYTNTIATETGSHDLDLNIGESSTTLNPWKGYIDEVKIYDYPLSAAEIKTLYNSYLPDGGSGNYIGWWKLDDDSGTTATDSGNANNPAGIANDGTLQGGFDFSSNVVSGISGNALVYDGTDDYIDFNDLHSDLDGISEFSYSAWIYTDSTTINLNVLDKSSSSTSRVVFGQGGTGTGGSNDFFLALGNGSNSYGYTTQNWLATGYWYHVVMVYDGSGAANADKLKFYVSGKERSLTFANTIPTETPSTDVDFQSGREGGTGEQWSGYIDDIRVYNYPLSHGEIITLYNSYKPDGGSGNLIGHWKFDDDSGTTAIDSGNASRPGGIGNDGTLLGGFDFSSNVVTGVSGNALVFDGTDDYIDMNDLQTELDSISQFTAAFWMYKDSAAADSGWFFMKYSAAANRTGFHLTGPDDVRAHVANGADSYGETAQNWVSANTWYHLTMVYDGTGSANADRLKVFVNGKEMTLTFTSTIPATTHDVNDDFNINRSGGTYFKGYIDDFRLYDYAMSSTNVTTLYESYLPGGTSDNLIVWYKFDDDSGTTATDSGNTGNVNGTPNNGTLTGSFDFSTNVVTGISGNALVFDGTDDTIDSDDIQGGLDGQKEFTVSMWVKALAVAGSKAILTKRVGDSNRVHIELDGGGDDIVFNVGDGSNSYGSTSGGAFNNNQWYHIVAVYNGNETGNASRMQLYMNNQLMSLSFTGTIPAQTDNNDNDFLVGSEAAANYWNGYMDDLKIYDYAFTAANVQEAYDEYIPNASSDNYIGWYKFDDDSGTTAIDSGNTGLAVNDNNEGTLNGTFDFSSNVVSGISGNALSFDGTDDYIDLNDMQGMLDNITEFSISVWILTTDDAADAFDPIFSKKLDNSNRIILNTGVNDDEIRFSLSSTTHGVTDGDFISQNVWYHVVVVYDGKGAANADRLKIYIDGIERTLTFTGTIPTSFPSNNVDAKIGYNSADTRWWEGLIDDVILYNYPLSAANVQTLYDSYLPDGGAGNYIGWWKFDDDSGTTAIDSGNANNPGGIGNDGTLSGSFDFSSNVTTGISGNALVFDGTDDKIDLNDLNSDLDKRTEFSISALFYWTDDPTHAYDPIFTKKASGTSRILINLGSADDDIRFAVSDGGDTYGDTSGDFISENVWYHVVCVFDGNGATNADRMQVYINGIDRALTFSGTIPAASPSIDTDAEIGYNSSDTRFWEGQIDDVRIYDYPLSAANVTTLYESYLPAQATGMSSNLIGHWEFDDDSGTTATDELAQYNLGQTGGIQGTLTGGLDFSSNVTTGVSGNTLIFDNSSDYVDFDDMNGAFDALTAFTISVWIRISDDDNSDTIFSKYVGTNDRVELRIINSGAQTNLEFDICDGSNAHGDTSGAPLSKGSWQHVVAVYDGSGAANADRMKIYVDNTEYALTFTGTIPAQLDSNNAEARIGARTTNANYWHGYIDDFRIYDFPLSAANIQDLYLEKIPDGGSGNYIGWWKFDDDSGTTAIDSGNANNPGGFGIDGTLTGGMDFSSNVVTGISGNALVIEDGDYINLGDMQNDFDGIGAFTISAWVYVTDDSDDDSIFSKYNGTNDRVEIRNSGSDYGQNDIQFVLANGSNSWGSTTDNSYLKGTWHHIVGVFDGSGAANADRMKLYLNNVEKTLTFSGTIPSTTSIINDSAQLGQRNTGWGTFQGVLDDYRIYNYAISASNVQDHFEMGRLQAGLVGHWSLDETSGTSADDANLRDHDGTLTNMTFAANTMTGQISNALSFDGTDDYIDLDSYVSDYNGLNEGSVSLWFKTSTTQRGGLLAINDQGEDDRFVLELDADQTIHAVVRNSNTNLVELRTTSTSWNDNNWHHVVFIQSSDNCKLYVDNSVVSLSTSDNTGEFFNDVSNLDQMQIGLDNRSGGTFYFDGAIDDVRIYNRVLDATDVNTLYTQ